MENSLISGNSEGSGKRRWVGLGISFWVFVVFRSRKNLRKRFFLLGSKDMLIFEPALYLPLGWSMGEGLITNNFKLHVGIGPKFKLIVYE
jgi:hypothetical protein